MAKRIESLGIPIQRYPYGETSQIVHLLTRDHGRMVVLARGAFRDKNSYQGPLDLMVRGNMTISTVKGRGLGLLLSRKVETNYPAVRRDLVRFAAATRMMKLIVQTIPVGEGERDVFRGFDRALLRLESIQRDRIPILMLSYDLHLLGLLGLSPQLMQCVRCGRMQALHRFWAAQGGALCRKCSQSSEVGIPMPQKVWALLVDLANHRLGDIDTPEPAVAHRAQLLLENHEAYHLEWQAPGALTPRLLRGTLKPRRR